jgi:SpoVK/Ycf46/Vps4 family AAA+-type ATPase
MTTILEKCINERLLETPYQNNREYIEDWIAYVDYKISFFLTRILNIYNTDSKADQYKGLIIRRDEIVSIVDAMSINSSSLEHEILQEHYDISDRIEHYIHIREVMSVEEGSFLPFAYVRHMLKLNSFEQFCVALALISQIDKRYERIFGYIQEDITKKLPTAEIAIKVYYPAVQSIQLTEVLAAMEQKLFRYVLPEFQQTANTFDRILFVDHRLRNFIMDVPIDDKFDNNSMEMFYPGDSVEPIIVQAEWQNKLKQILEGREQCPLICFLHGDAGSGKKLQLKTVANQLKRAVVFVKAKSLFHKEGVLEQRQISKVIREVILHGSILCMLELESIPSYGTEQLRHRMQEFFNSISGLIENVFLLSNVSPADAGLANLDSKPYQWIDLEIPLPNRKQRKQIWEHMTKGLALSAEIEMYELANKFELTSGQINNAIREASEQLEWQGMSTIDAGTLYKACFGQITHRLDTLATVVLTKYTLNDLILPADQKQVLINACNHVKYRHIVLDEWGFDDKLAYGKGLSMMFGGPPGTGKTMAAQVIAHELGLEMYKIDLSQLISKYIGETEKNLKEVFQEARKSNAILFFDECDAIFGKRTEVKDSHDRYANMETAYLLQKIEEYSGVSVLATNYVSNIDSAFLRRIQYVINFPFPDEQSREQIWMTVFPDKTPIANDVDFGFLAKQFELAGGNIKNIAVNASFLAAAENSGVTMSHLIKSTKDEVTKQGKVVVASDFGEYGFYLRS